MRISNFPKNFQLSSTQKIFIVKLHPTCFFIEFIEFIEFIDLSGATFIIVEKQTIRFYPSIVRIIRVVIVTNSNLKKQTTVSDTMRCSAAENSRQIASQLTIVPFCSNRLRSFCKASVFSSVLRFEQVSIAFCKDL